jgi:hypothetical protein
MALLFTKDGCGKCDWVKTHVELDRVKNLEIVKLDNKNPDALATLAFHECVALAEKSMPILVGDGGEVITGAIHIKNYLAENCS